MSIQSKLRIISDYLHYVSLYAPNFPPEDNTNLQKSFEQIFRGIEDVMPSIDDATKRNGILLSLQEMREAYQRYAAGQSDLGEKLLRTATERFDNVMKGKILKSRFAVDPSGNVGEFEKKNSN